MDIDYADRVPIPPTWLGSNARGRYLHIGSRLVDAFRVLLRCSGRGSVVARHAVCRTREARQNAISMALPPGFTEGCVVGVHKLDHQLNRPGLFWLSHDPQRIQNW